MSSIDRLDNYLKKQLLEDKQMRINNPPQMSQMSINKESFKTFHKLKLSQSPLSGQTSSCSEDLHEFLVRIRQEQRLRLKKMRQFHQDACNVIDLENHALYHELLLQEGENDYNFEEKQEEFNIHSPPSSPPPPPPPTRPLLPFMNDNFNVANFCGNDGNESTMEILNVLKASRMSRAYLIKQLMRNSGISIKQGRKENEEDDDERGVRGDENDDNNLTLNSLLGFEI